MKKIFTFALIAWCAGNPAFSQATELRALATYTEVRTADNITVIITPADENKVNIETKNLQANKVLTELSKKELKFTTKGSFNDAEVTCHLSCAQTLTKLTPTYGGMIKTADGVILTGKKLEIDANLDGFVNLVVDVEELYITAGQGSDLYITGKANKVTIDATSGGKVHTETLICKDAVVKSGLGAKVWLTAGENYEAKAVSGGKIYYSKAPTGKFEPSEYTGGKVILE